MSRDAIVCVHHLRKLLLHLQNTLLKRIMFCKFSYSFLRIIKKRLVLAEAVAAVAGISMNLERRSDKDDAFVSAATPPTLCRQLVWLTDRPSISHEQSVYLQ